MSCFQGEESQPTVFHCTVCSHVSEHPYCLPPNLLPFSVTLSEMKGPELYADTGETFKQSEARPRKMNKILISKTVRILGEPGGQIELCMQYLLISVSGMEEAEKGKYK